MPGERILPKTFSEIDIAQNRIQCQKGSSIHEFFHMYGTEDKCRRSPEKFRRSDGFVCRSCGHESYCYLRTRKLYQCSRCRSQTSVTCDTAFHSANLPSTKWFPAMFLPVRSKNGISSLEPKRQIGVSYPTAFKLKHKPMRTMMERDRRKSLSGPVEADDAYLGGKRRSGKRGRGAGSRQLSVAAVEVDLENRPKRTKLSAVKSFAGREVEKWAERSLSPEAGYVVADGLSCFKALGDTVRLHIAKPIGKGQKSTDDPAFRWVDATLGNVKNSIEGTYRANRKITADRYLAEFRYRFDRRYDSRGILPRPIHASVRTPPLPGNLLKLTANS